MGGCDAIKEFACVNYHNLVWRACGPERTLSVVCHSAGVGLDCGKHDHACNRSGLVPKIDRQKHPGANAYHVVTAESYRRVLQQAHSGLDPGSSAGGPAVGVGVSESLLS